MSTLFVGVNPNIEYPRPYRVFVELWIYMGLAWLSLFFSWNVHMVVQAHQVLKKRRHRHRHPHGQEPQPVEEKAQKQINPDAIDIFKFLSEKDDDYSTVIKQIGVMAKKRKPAENINRSKSCSDILATDIQTLDHSPRHRRMISITDVFMNAKADKDKGEQEDVQPLIQDKTAEPEPAVCMVTDMGDNEDSSAFENKGIVFTVPAEEAADEETVQHPGGGETRFKISKVAGQRLSL